MVDKWAEKSGYSLIEIREYNGKVFKAVKFDLDNIDFGRFNTPIKNQKSKKGKYKILEEIYKELVRIGFYPPETKFKVKGSKLQPTFSIEMPLLVVDATKLPKRKIAKVEDFLMIKPLFWDIYHLHNYMILDGETYYIDMEIFPKLG